MDNNGRSSQFFLCVCLIAFVPAARSVVIELESYRQEYNSDIFKNITIDLRTEGKRKILNGSVIIAIDIHQFEMTATLQVPRKNGHAIKMFNMTIDGCDFVSKDFAKSINLSQLVVKDIRRVMKNVPTKCPLKKDTEVILADLYIDSSNWPIYVPESPFIFTLTMRQGKTIGFQFFIKGAVQANRHRLGKQKAKTS